MKKIDILFFLTLCIFYIAAFKINIFMRSHLVDES